MTRILPAAAMAAVLLMAGCDDDDAQPAPPTYSITGAVTGTGGVTVTLSGAATATTTTDASGAYAFGDLVAGSYTVTPSKAAHAFSPASRAVTVGAANVTGQDFAASYALEGTTWSYCHVEENMPQDEWETFTFLGNRLYRTQLEYESADSSCTGAAHGEVTNASVFTFTDGGEVAATLAGAPVTARAVAAVAEDASPLAGLLYLDAAPEPDVLYVAFDPAAEPAALWSRAYAKEAAAGVTAPALQGTWISCDSEDGNDLREVFTVSGYRIAVSAVAYSSTDGSCTGTATPRFEESAAFVLRGVTPATLGAATVTARAADVVFSGSAAAMYSIVYVDASATPNVLYTGDEAAEAGRDGSAPSARPRVLHLAKPRLKQP